MKKDIFGIVLIVLLGISAILTVLSFMIPHILGPWPLGVFVFIIIITLITATLEDVNIDVKKRKNGRSFKK